MTALLVPGDEIAGCRVVRPLSDKDFAATYEATSEEGRVHLKVYLLR